MACEVRKVIEEAHDMPILCVAYNNIRKELYSGGQDSLIKVWEVETGRNIRKQSGQMGWVTTMFYMPVTRTLCSASIDGTIRVWNEKGKQLQKVSTNTTTTTTLSVTHTVQGSTLLLRT